MPGIGKAGAVVLASGLLLAAAASICPAQAGGTSAGDARTGDPTGGGVVVHRGADIALETNLSNKAARDEQGVAVHRGKLPPRKSKAPDGAETRAVQVSAGEELWFVERETGRLIACQLRKTSTVGQSAIDCTRGRVTRSGF